MPLLALHSSPTESGQIIGPMYAYRSPKGWSGGLFPLLHLQDFDGRWAVIENDNRKDSMGEGQTVVVDTTAGHPVPVIVPDALGTFITIDRG